LLPYGVLTIRQVAAKPPPAINCGNPAKAW
jgi:hypothetical protein